MRMPSPPDDTVNPVFSTSPNSNVTLVGSPAPCPLRHRQTVPAPVLVGVDVGDGNMRHQSSPGISEPAGTCQEQHHLLRRSHSLHTQPGSVRNYHTGNMQTRGSRRNRHISSRRIENSRRRCEVPGDKRHRLRQRGPYRSTATFPAVMGDRYLLTVILNVDGRAKAGEASCLARALPGRDILESRARSEVVLLR